MPLRTSAKGGCKEKIARITNKYAEDIWAPFVGFPFIPLHRFGIHNPFSNLNFFVKHRQNFFDIELLNIH